MLQWKRKAHEIIPPLRGAGGCASIRVSCLWLRSISDAALQSLPFASLFTVDDIDDTPLAPLKGGIFRCVAKRLFLVSVAAIFLASCASQSDNPLTQPEKFAEVYTTLQIIAAQDSTVAARVDSILQQHDYTRAQFDEAVRYYNAHAEEWAKVVQQSVSRLDSLVREEARQDSLRHKTDGAHVP